MNTMNTMKIRSTLIFINITSPFYILKGLCTGEVEYQVIIAKNENGEMELDSIEPIDISKITFAGNELGMLGYKEYQEWEKKIDSLFNCNVSELIYNSAERRIDKEALTEYASKIQLPNTSNKRNTECDGGCGCICCDM
jgi:hypothetical protein